MSDICIRCPIRTQALDILKACSLFTLLGRLVRSSSRLDGVRSVLSTRCSEIASDDYIRKKQMDCCKLFQNLLFFLQTITVAIGMSACRQSFYPFRWLTDGIIIFLMVTYENQKRFVVRFADVFSKNRIFLRCLQLAINKK